MSVRPRERCSATKTTKSRNKSKFCPAKTLTRSSQLILRRAQHEIQQLPQRLFELLVLLDGRRAEFAAKEFDEETALPVHESHRQEAADEMIDDLVGGIGAG